MAKNRSELRVSHHWICSMRFFSSVAVPVTICGSAVILYYGRFYLLNDKKILPMCILLLVLKKQWFIVSTPKIPRRICCDYGWSSAEKVLQTKSAEACYFNRYFKRKLQA